VIVACSRAGRRTADRDALKLMRRMRDRADLPPPSTQAYLACLRCWCCFCTSRMLAIAWIGDASSSQH
jgi:hypothetical protein